MNRASALALSDHVRQLERVAIAATRLAARRDDDKAHLVLDFELNELARLRGDLTSALLASCAHAELTTIASATEEGAS